MFKVVLLATAIALPLLAQSPTYHVGRAASPAEIARRDISIAPDGTGLPPGQGTAAEGAVIYENRCRECHGPNGEGADETGFIGKPSELIGDSPNKTVGSYWSHTTTLWDYINRAMPFDRPGELSNDQVYAVVAYLLHLNDLVGEDDELDAEALLNVKMPNRDGFVADPRPESF